MVGIISVIVIGFGIFDSSGCKVLGNVVIMNIRFVVINKNSWIRL